MSEFCKDDDLTLLDEPFPDLIEEPPSAPDDTQMLEEIDQWLFDHSNGLITPLLLLPILF